MSLYIHVCIKQLHIITCAGHVPGVMSLYIYVCMYQGVTYIMNELRVCLFYAHEMQHTLRMIISWSIR